MKKENLGYESVRVRRKTHNQLMKLKQESGVPVIEILTRVVQKIKKKDLLVLVFLLISASAYAEVDTDKYADAIFKAEGGYSATYLYGIRSIPYETEAQARQYCKNTVYNTLVKYRESRCKEGESDIDCIARRYCPVGSDTDNGTCKYWKKNVEYFLTKGE